MCSGLDLQVATTFVAIKFAGQGCSISQSSASMMTAALKGKSLADARALLHRFKSMMNGEEYDSTNAEAGKVRLGDLEALKGVVKFPVRIKCATLAWNTFAQALDEAT